MKLEVHQGGNTQTQEEWTGELEQRIVDLESESVNLRQMVERIGREKRICGVSVRTGWMIYFLMFLMAVDVGLALVAILK